MSVPAGPGTPAISNVTSSTLTATIIDGNDGGHPITYRQIGWSTTNVAVPTNVAASGGVSNLTGFTPGKTYYFKARCSNVEGWGPWSSARTITMDNTPAGPGTPLISNITQTSMTVTFVDGNSGGSPITSRAFGYSLSPNGDPDTTFSYDGSPANVGNLLPGRIYYVKAKATNTYGSGPYSNAATVVLVAGAYVNVNGVWKRAVPYTKTNGVWRLTRPQGRYLGYWNDTTS